jgi:hypothetical protein
MHRCLHVFTRATLRDQRRPRTADSGRGARGTCTVTASEKPPLNLIETVPFWSMGKLDADAQTVPSAGY